MSGEKRTDTVSIVLTLGEFGAMLVTITLLSPLVAAPVAYAIATGLVFCVLATISIMRSTKKTK